VTVIERRGIVVKAQMHYAIGGTADRASTHIAVSRQDLVACETALALERSPALSVRHLFPANARHCGLRCRSLLTDCTPGTPRVTASAF
jgi:hypothetical protein